MEHATYGRKMLVSGRAQIQQTLGADSPLATSIRSCVGEPLKRNVGLPSKLWECSIGTNHVERVSVLFVAWRSKNGKAKMGQMGSLCGAREKSPLLTNLSMKMPRYLKKRGEHLDYPRSLKSTVMIVRIIAF